MWKRLSGANVLAGGCWLHRAGPGPPIDPKCLGSNLFALTAAVGARVPADN